MPTYSKKEERKPKKIIKKKMKVPTITITEAPKKIKKKPKATPPVPPLEKKKFKIKLPKEEEKPKGKGPAKPKMEEKKVKGAGEKELLYLRTIDSFPLHPYEARDILLKTIFGREKRIDAKTTTRSLLDRKKSTKKEALDNIKKRIKEEKEGFFGKTSMVSEKIINLKEAEQWVKANYNKYIVADPKKVDMKKYRKS